MYVNVIYSYTVQKEYTAKAAKCQYLAAPTGDSMTAFCVKKCDRAKRKIENVTLYAAFCEHFSAPLDIR